MFKKLSIISSAALLSACQTTADISSVQSTDYRISSSNTEIMKDTQPRGLGPRQWGQWNDDMPENAWAFNLTNIVPARSGELSQRFELRNGDCTVRRIPGNNHPYDWGCRHWRECEPASIEDEAELIRGQDKGLKKVEVPADGPSCWSYKRQPIE